MRSLFTSALFGKKKRKEIKLFVEHILALAKEQDLDTLGQLANEAGVRLWESGASDFVSEISNTYSITPLDDENSEEKPEKSIGYEVSFNVNIVNGNYASSGYGGVYLEEGDRVSPQEVVVWTNAKKSYVGIRFVTALVDKPSDISELRKYLKEVSVRLYNEFFNELVSEEPVLTDSRLFEYRSLSERLTSERFIRFPLLFEKLSLQSREQRMNSF